MTRTRTIIATLCAIGFAALGATLVQPDCGPALWLAALCAVGAAGVDEYAAQ